MTACFDLSRAFRSTLVLHFPKGICNALGAVWLFKMLHWRGVIGDGSQPGSIVFCGTLVSLLFVNKHPFGHWHRQNWAWYWFTCTYHVKHVNGIKVETDSHRRYSTLVKPWGSFAQRCQFAMIQTRQLIHYHVGNIFSRPILCSPYIWHALPGLSIRYRHLVIPSRNRFLM
jgi:hypothetical protein